MSDLIPEGSPAAGLIARVKDILLKPAETWTVIDGEADSTNSLFTRYVLPLAAIGPVASAIGLTVFGMTVPFLGTIRPGVSAVLVTSVLGFVAAIISVFVLAFVTDMLAPSFGGTKNSVQSFKVAAYASTAAWVAGIFGLIPMLGLLALLGGLYSLYLLYLGAPKLMKVPADKAVGFVVVTIIMAFIVRLIVGAVISAITTPMLMPSLSSIAQGLPN